MENLFDFEGSSVDYRVLATSADLKDDLITSLLSFARLHCQRRHRLQKASESFTLAASQLHEVQDEASDNETACGLFTLVGGLVGAGWGGASGGVCGALGAIGVATFSRFYDDINAVGATFGFVGSVLGGVVGGVFAGAVGSAVSAAAKANGRPVHGVVSDVLSFTIGFGTGVAIGGIFGGSAGAAGGGIGGSFGALYATRIAVSVVGEVVVCFRGAKKDQNMRSKKANMTQESKDFFEAIVPLVEELQTIKRISDEMASSDDVHSVAGRAEKTLDSVTTMVKAFSDSQRAKDLPQFVSRVEEAVRQSKKITEQLKTTRQEVERLLVSLRKH